MNFAINLSPTSKSQIQICDKIHIPLLLLLFLNATDMHALNKQHASEAVGGETSGYSKWLVDVLLS